LQHYYMQAITNRYKPKKCSNEPPTGFFCCFLCRRVKKIFLLSNATFMSQNGEGKGEKAKIGLSGLLGLLGGGPFMGTAMRSVLKGQFAGWAIHIQTFRPPIGCGGIPQPYTMLGEEAGLATVDLLYHACSPCIILYHPSCTTHLYHPVSPILCHPPCIILYHPPCIILYHPVSPILYHPPVSSCITHPVPPTLYHPVPPILYHPPCIILYHPSCATHPVSSCIILYHPPCIILYHPSCTTHLYHPVSPILYHACSPYCLEALHPL